MKLKNKIMRDMFLNILAAAMPVAVLQLVIYPITAEKLGGNEYGFMITIYSVWIMISNSIGNVLNNVRLLHNSKYEDEALSGDFSILLRRWFVINAVIICIIIIIYNDDFKFLHIFLEIIVACLILLYAYLEVGFRIKLNYKAIVCNNLLQSIGFLIGCGITMYTGIWELIFVCGYMFSCLFCIMRTSLLTEKAAKTKYYKQTVKDSNNLMLASIIGNLMNYADKLVLYPLMGGYAVSIYYTATILGKIVGMLTTPINGVILSYIARYDDSHRGIMYKVLIVGSAVVTLGYIGTMIIGRPVISILFPQWVDEVMMYLPVTTITVCLMALIAFIQPFVLKFCDLKWQIVIMTCGSATYFLSALILWKFMGLMGFCLGTIIGALVKLGIMLFVYSLKK